jgi:hypothetical protein
MWLIFGNSTRARRVPGGRQTEPRPAPKRAEPTPRPRQSPKDLDRMLADLKKKMRDERSE